ncbi:hypothetical protein [Burkholderia glumae]
MRIEQAIKDAAPVQRTECAGSFAENGKAVSPAKLSRATSQPDYIVALRRGHWISTALADEWPQPTSDATDRLSVFLIRLFLDVQNMVKGCAFSNNTNIK